AGRLWRGPLATLHLFGLIERARPGEIAGAIRAHPVPLTLPRNRGKALDEARGHCWSAAKSRGICEDHFPRPQRLREIMRRERDPPLWQIESEYVAHGAAQPRIRARLRRPYAFDQTSQYDPVSVLEPRF